MASVVDSADPSRDLDGDGDDDPGGGGHADDSDTNVLMSRW